MSKFRKKPVVVEAVQWHHGDPPRAGMTPYSEGTIEQFPHYKGFYFIGPLEGTLEGNHHVSDGDWVITGIQGERYPCKPEIFKETYEPCEKQPSTA